MGECDLFEYCNGTSALCPANVVVQNGHSCGENQWICVDGSCISPPEQCKSIFGEGIYYQLISHPCVFLEAGNKLIMI